MAHNSPEAVAQQNAAMKSQLAHVSALVEDYTQISTDNAGKSVSIEENGKQSAAHTAVVKETYKLLHAIKGPVDSVYSHFENVALTGAVRALLEMGMFDALPQNGTSKTADVLAEELNADKQVIVRLMRMVTIWGPFREVDVEEYAHTPHSLVYQNPQLNGVFKLLYAFPTRNRALLDLTRINADPDLEHSVDEYQPAKLRFFEFFKKNGWVNPVQDRNCPYTFVHQTEGKNMWEYMVQFPDRLDVFNNAMQAQSTAASSSVSRYPFREVLSPLETTIETPLVVDIGGGKGHTINQIRDLTGPDVKGRYILQERQVVLDTIGRDEIPGIEREEYNFFTPQPLKGAKIYYLRRIFHDWPDAVCLEVLQNVAAGIIDKTQQRIVIQDGVIPEKGADAESAWSDLTMMTLTGEERTEKHWRELLGNAGFKLSRIIVSPGTNWAAVEAFLK